MAGVSGVQPTMTGTTRETVTQARACERKDKPELVLLYKREVLVMADFAPEIVELGDKIVGLSLLQAKSLADYLKEKHGIEAAAGAAVVMSGGGGGGGGG